MEGVCTFVDADSLLLASTGVESKISTSDVVDSLRSLLSSLAGMIELQLVLCSFDDRLLAPWNSLDRSCCTSMTSGSSDRESKKAPDGEASCKSAILS